jgi:transposase
MDTDEKERIVAVNRCVKGEKRTDICKNLNQSKGWLSKWVNRYKTGQEDWYKSKSKAPKNPGKKTRDEIENAVVNIRKTLMDGSIENFNKWFGEKFWDKEIFANLEDMRTKSTHFVDQY